MKSQGLCGGGDGVPLFLANFPNGLLSDFRLPRRPLMVRAALLRRSCGGVAAASLRRRCADQLRRAHSARRVRDGADAAATELMLRAALLRRSCKEVHKPTLEIYFNGRGSQSYAPS